MPRQTPRAYVICLAVNRYEDEVSSITTRGPWQGNGPGYTWTSDNPNARTGVDQIVRQPSHHRRFDYVFVGSWDFHPKARAQIQSAMLAFDKPI
jgi:hypothetical protein